MAHQEQFIARNASRGSLSDSKPTSVFLHSPIHGFASQKPLRIQSKPDRSSSIQEFLDSGCPPVRCSRLELPEYHHELSRSPSPSTNAGCSTCSNATCTPESGLLSSPGSSAAIPPPLIIGPSSVQCILACTTTASPERDYCHVGVYPLICPPLNPVEIKSTNEALPDEDNARGWMPNLSLPGVSSRSLGHLEDFSDQGSRHGVASMWSNSIDNNLTYGCKAHPHLHVYDDIYIYEMSSFSYFYQLGEFIGYGSEGKVWSCHPVHDESYEYAVKITPKDYRLKLRNSPGAGDDSRSYRDHLCEMAIRVARLKHKSVLNYIALYEDPSNFYVLMEKANGPALFEYLLRKKDPNENDCKDVFKQVLKGLEYIHSQGLVHRDIKPENYVFRHPLDSPRVSELLLIDFGLTCRVDNISRHAPIGTKMYMSPELYLAGYQCNQMIDIWAAGILLCMLLTGTSPFGIEGVSGYLEKVYPQTMVQSARHGFTSRHSPTSPLLTTVSPRDGVAFEQFDTVIEASPTRLHKDAYASINSKSERLELLLRLKTHTRDFDLDQSVLKWPPNDGGESVEPSNRKFLLTEMYRLNVRDQLLGPTWAHISEKAKCLVRALLTPNPCLRHTATQALGHSWFEDSSPTSLQQQEKSFPVEIVERWKDVTRRKQICRQATFGGRISAYSPVLRRCQTVFLIDPSPRTVRELEI